MSYVDQPKTLLERVTFYLEYDRIKHDLRHDHTTREVNSWTNYELLERLSEALETMKEQKNEC